MNVNPINQPITTNQNFEGKIIKRGPWPKYLAEKFDCCHTFSNIKNKDFNLVATIHTKKADNTDKRHIAGQNLYKLVLTAEKEKPSFIESLKYMFGFNKKLELSENYHSVDSTKNRIMRIKPESIKNALNVEI